MLTASLFFLSFQYDSVVYPAAAFVLLPLLPLLMLLPLLLYVDLLLILMLLPLDAVVVAASPVAVPVFI